MSENSGITGFTLLEIMISLLIFSVGILAIGQMQISAIRGNDFSSEFTVALVLAQNQIDYLSALDYQHGDLADTNENGTTGLSETAAADHKKTCQKKYAVFWNTAADHPEDGSTQIRVIVQWKTGSRTRQVSLDALKIE